MKGLSEQQSSSYSLRPRIQSQAQIDRQQRQQQLNHFLRHPRSYTTASSDWYLIKIKSNQCSKNGFRVEYISRVMRGNNNGGDLDPGDQSPYWFNVKYAGELVLSDNSVNSVSTQSF